MNVENPLIVQGDRSLLLDVHAPLAEECRNALIPFAELEKSPEHLHTYRLTPLSLWNAASAGFSAMTASPIVECKKFRNEILEKVPADDPDPKQKTVDAVMQILEKTHDEVEKTR